MITRTKAKKAEKKFWKRVNYLLNNILKVGKVNREEFVSHKNVLELFPEKQIGGQSVIPRYQLLLWKLQLSA